MKLDQKQPSNKGEFFAISVKTVKEIINADAGVEELMAYIVLARGVNVRGDKRISTHGAKSISTRTGMSYRKAEAALDTVEQMGIVHKAEDKSDAVSPKKLHARWILQDEPVDIYLANSLIDGIGQGKHNPPLMRIYSQVSLGTNCLMSEARLDAVMVLLYLYLHQDMQGCGGVNPRVGIYREWKSCGEIIDINGTNAALYEVERSHEVVFKKFAAEALFYVTDEGERHSRFWDAFKNLKTFGFFYEVTQVWSGNPNGTNGIKAEPLYTLYIHDRYAREAAEPYLQRQVHEVAFRCGAMDRTNAFRDDYQLEDYFINTGRFRYIVPKKMGGFPIGIYRLKFRPKTKDVGLGIQAEQHRFEQWDTIFRSYINNQ